MPISPYDHKDIVGLESPGGSQYGQLAAQRARNQSLKQYAPASMKFTNIDPGVAPGRKTIPPVKGAAPLAQSIPSPVQKAQPATASAIPGPQKTGSPVSQPQQQNRGFGPSSGLGQEPGSAPVAENGPHRGFGEASGLEAGGQESVGNQPLPPSPHAMMTRTMSEAFRHLAALPHASPVIKMYARIAAQRDQRSQ